MAEQNKSNLPDSIKNLLKLELHAHLNGSLSKDCLRNLANLTTNNQDRAYNLTAFNDLKSCFDVFAIAHSLTTTFEAVKLATVSCIQDFANDNVVYLELRSTPRSTSSMSKSDYISAIIAGIKESDQNKILTSLIISINRGHSVEEASENVEIAIKFSKMCPEIVVGVDLCGNPFDGNFVDFLPALNKARDSDLKITLHCGEIENDAEVKEMINFHPDRLSHVTQLSKDAIAEIIELSIPVELCVTSNLKCKTVTNVKDHQLQFYYKTDHPFILGTDDKGVFDTTLSEEYTAVQKSFHVNEDFFRMMNEKAIAFSFASETIKEKLKLKFKG